MDLETIKLKIRKNKDIIYTNGYGVLVFMLWGIIKMILYFIDIAPKISPNVNDELDILYISFITTGSIVENILTIITGIVAIRVGKKDKSSRVALAILSIITFLLSLEFVIGDILLCVMVMANNLSTIIINIVTEVFFLTITLFLSISSIKLIRLCRLEKEATINER